MTRSPDLLVGMIQVVVRKLCSLNLYGQQTQGLSGHPLPRGQDEGCVEDRPHTPDLETQPKEC